MKINRLILIGGAFAGIITTNPFTIYAESPTPASSENALITWTAGGKQSKKVDVLFVQNAKDMSFGEGKLVLREVNPVTVCFTDRPARMAGHMQTSKLIPLWSQGRTASLRTILMPRSRSLVATTYRTLSLSLATRSSPATISPTTRAFSKAPRQLMGEPVRCLSISLACQLLPCPMPVSRAVPGVASRAW